MDELNAAFREQVELGKQLAKTYDPGEREAIKAQLDEAKRRFASLTERYYAAEREAKEAEVRKKAEELQRKASRELEERLKQQAFAASGLDPLAFEALWKSRLRDELLAKHTLQRMSEAQLQLREQIKNWFAG
jgi:hypothetical protein